MRELTLEVLNGKDVRKIIESVQVTGGYLAGREVNITVKNPKDSRAVEKALYNHKRSDVVLNFEPTQHGFKMNVDAKTDKDALKIVKDILTANSIKVESNDSVDSA